MKPHKLQVWSALYTFFEKKRRRKRGTNYSQKNSLSPVQRQIRAHRKLGSIDRWREIPPAKGPAA